MIGSSRDSPVTLLTSSSYAGSSTVNRPPGLRGPLLGVTAALARSVAENSQDNRRMENDSKLSGGKDDGCLGFLSSHYRYGLLSHSELYCSMALFHCPYICSRCHTVDNCSVISISKHALSHSYPLFPHLSLRITFIVITLQGTEFIVSHKQI